MLLRDRLFGAAKPPMGALIDWGHPLAQGLEVCVVAQQGGVPTDLVTNRRFFIGNGSPGWNARNGGSMKLAFATVDWYEMAAPDALFTRATGVSLLWAGIVDVTNQYHAFINKLGGSDLIDFRANSANPLTIFFGRESTTFHNSSASLSILDPHQLVVAVQSDLASQARLWIDAHEETFTKTGGGSGPPGTSGTNAALRLGNRSGDNFVQMDGVTTRAYVWSRPLQDDEVKWLQAEPYAFLVGKSAGRFPITTAGASNATATPDAVVVTVMAPTIAGIDATAHPSAVVVTATIGAPSAGGVATATPAAVLVTVHISNFSDTARPDAVVVSVVPVPVVPTVHSPFHEEADLRFDVIDLADMTTIITSLDNRVSGAWQDIISDTGTGELVLLNDDTAVDEMTFPNRLTNCYYRGVLAFTLLPEAVQRVVVAEGEESEQRSAYTCRGHGALFDRGLIYPTLGVGRQPIEEDRGFNWTSPVFNDSAWVPAKVVCTVGQAKVSWSIPWNPDLADDTAAVLWDVDGDFLEAVPGTVYIRQDFTVSTTAVYVLDASVDNYGEFYIDGQLIQSPGQSSGNFGNAFLTTNRVQVQVSAGAHVMAIRAVGIAFPEPAVPGGYPGSQLYNPAGASWSLHLNDSTTSDLGTLVAHSNSTAVILPRPAAVPGMTPGQVLGIVIDEAQARGAIPYVTRSFSDTHDTGGLAWTEAADIATKVGTTLLTFWKELSGTYIDWRLRPGTTILDAFVFGTMGSATGVDYHTPTDPDDPMTGNITELHETEEA